MLIFQGVSIVSVALFHLKSSSKNICSRMQESQMMVDGNHGEPLLNKPNGDFFLGPQKRPFKTEPNVGDLRPKWPKQITFGQWNPPKKLLLGNPPKNMDPI